MLRGKTYLFSFYAKYYFLTRDYLWVIFFLIYSFYFSVSLLFSIYFRRKTFLNYTLFLFLFLFFILVYRWIFYLSSIHLSIFLSFLTTSFLASFSKFPSLLPFIYRNAWITWIGKITGQKTVSQRNGNEKNSSTKGDISCSTNGVRTRNIWYSVLTLSHSPVSAIILYRICLSLSWSIDEP